MKQFRSILVHVDTRTDFQMLWREATQLAQAHSASLTVVELVPDLPARVAGGKPDYAEMQRLLVQKKQAQIDALAAAAGQMGVSASAKVLTGRTSAALIAEVTSGKHDLVIKVAKGAESPRTGLLGSTAIRLLRFCPCTVWAYRPRSGTGVRKVVAAVDVMPADERHGRLNRDILEAAQGLSSAPVHVAYVWSVYGERLIKDYMKREEFDALVQEEVEQARARLARLLTPLGISADAPEVHLLRGSEEDEIARLVVDQQFDMLVLGTVGRSGLSGMLIGNTAEVLVDRVPCSVVAVKPAEFVSPWSP
ncbi:MAG: universal stress protein [Pirellulaceae bacterium]